MRQKTWLYAITRRDLPLAQQAVQLSHAAAEHAYSFGRPPDHHPSFVFLTIRDQASLEQRRDVLNAAGINTAEFHEPHNNWGLTGIACLLTEDNRDLLRDLPLFKLPTQKEIA